MLQEILQNFATRGLIMGSIKRVLVVCTQADEFIDLDDLVTRLCLMDDYSVTASVHAGLLGFAQHSR